MLKYYKLTDSLKEPSFPLYADIAVVDGDFHKHSHEFSELVIVLDGIGLHDVGKDKFSLTPGDVFVITDDCEHAFRDCRKLKLCNIMYDKKQFLSQNDDLMSMPGFHSLFTLEPEFRNSHKFESHLKLNTDQLLHMNELIRKIVSEFESRVSGYKTASTALFRQIVVDLSRFYQQVDNPITTTLIRIGEALSFLQEHYTEKVTLPELADIACMSENHFLRIFRKCYGDSPINYLVKLRIQHAMDYLRNTDFTISEISEKVGFEDSNYFARQFKKHNGNSPSEFRK